jgi:GMP synthase (glutamine-hydrolysing)
MKVLVIRNAPTDPLGLLAPPLADRGLAAVEWRPQEAPPPAALDPFAAVIALGGATNPDEDGTRSWLAAERALLRTAVEREVPVLGVCLGAELLAQALGGRAYRLPEMRVGWYPLAAGDGAAADPLAPAWRRLRHVVEWHRYGFTLPPGGALLAGTPDAVQAFRFGPCAWGVQYHAEADRSLVREWASGDDAPDLREAGVTAAALAAAGERHGAAAEEHGTALAGAFAAVARA